MNSVPSILKRVYLWCLDRKIDSILYNDMRNIILMDICLTERKYDFPSQNSVQSTRRLNVWRKFSADYEEIEYMEK